MGDANMTLGQRVRELRLAVGFKTTNALAKAAGVPQSALRDIESDVTQSPQLKTLEKLAAALGAEVTDFYPKKPAADTPESFAWFWESRFSRLKISDLLELRNAPVETRVTWCLHQLAAAYSIEDLAAQLGTTPEHFANAMSGRDGISNHLIDQLESIYGVPAGFIFRGDPPKINDLLRKVLNHPDGGTYLAAVAKAIDNGILPELLLRQMDVLLMAANNKPPTR